MVAMTMASWAMSSRPRPPKAWTPMMRQMPAMPAITPEALRQEVGSCRVMAMVMRKVKIGVVELRMAARPASRVSSAQAMSVNGKTLERGLGGEQTPARKIARHAQAPQSQRHQQKKGGD